MLQILEDLTYKILEVITIILGSIVFLLIYIFFMIPYLIINRKRMEDNTWWQE
jgi:uncharacterized membrane protein